MSKLKIEHGASKVNWALLKISIEESIAVDIDRMCEWSNNDRKYVVNELLRFALTQSEDFQKHKADLGTGSSQPNIEAKSDPPQSKTRAHPATTASTTATTATNRD